MSCVRELCEAVPRKCQVSTIGQAKRIDSLFTLQSHAADVIDA